MKFRWITIIVVLSLAIGALIYIFFQEDELYCPKQRNVEIRNYTWDVDTYFNLNFDIYNNTDSTAYVMISDWYLDGVISLFKPKYNLSTESYKVNTIFYYPVHPSSRYFNIKTYLERARYRYFPTFIKLEPRQFQRMHILLNRKYYEVITKPISKMRLITYLYYITSANWEENRLLWEDAEHFDINKFVVLPTKNPFTFYIDKEGVHLHKNFANTPEKESSEPMSLEITNVGKLEHKF